MATFPLPTDFFRCPPLRSEDRRRIQDRARSFLPEVITRSRLSHPEMNWRISSDHGDCRVYEGSDPTTPSSVVSWAGVAHVSATLREVRELYVAHSTRAYRELNRIVTRNDTIDSMQLYTITDSENEHIDVRWFAYKSPLPGIVLPRDMCFIEIQQPFQWEGRQGYATGITDIDMKCCPDLRKALGLLRISCFRVGYIFLETDVPGQLEVTHHYQMDFHGQLPHWALRAAMKVRLKNIRDVDRYLREKRLSNTSFLPTTELIPTANRSRCFLCQTKFSMLRSKTQCRKCGEVMCRTCTRVWTIQNGGIEAQVSVCTPCSLNPSQDMAQEGNSIREPIILPSNSPNKFVHRLAPRSLPPEESEPPSPIVIFIPDEDDFDFIEDGIEEMKDYGHFGHDATVSSSSDFYHP
ncbi:hypothetical protein LEN26_006412 [Aphanomyces euteiches]|nr:hypothetical protein LEN26_006412 [Aphanomyces euteiches]